MASIVRQAESRFSNQQLFALVNRVQDYPEFIPWCHQVDLIHQQSHQLTARLHLKKGLLNHSFVSLNTLSPPHQMTMQLVEGPFKHFQGLWQFSRVNQCSQILFRLDYQFSSRLLTLTAGPVFHALADDLVNHFLHRAEQIYQ